MSNSALKTNSTQKFIEISDISGDIIVLENGNACSVIEVEATNFDLLSADEQDAKIYAYSSLLNSLSFSIQIVIRSKQLDISSYVKTLEDKAKNTQNQALSRQINLYKNFVAELIKINTVLDKKFYIVVSYSSLEQGALGTKQALTKNSGSDFLIGAKSALHSKAETIHTQLRRINLKANTLAKDELVKLFHDIFNDGTLDSSNINNHEQKQAEGKEVQK